MDVFAEQLTSKNVASDTANEVQLGVRVGKKVASHTAQGWAVQLGLWCNQARYSADRNHNPNRNPNPNHANVPTPEPHPDRREHFVLKRNDLTLTQLGHADEPNPLTL